MTGLFIEDMPFPSAGDVIEIAQNICDGEIYARYAIREPSVRTTMISTGKDKLCSANLIETTSIDHEWYKVSALYD